MTNIIFQRKNIEKEIKLDEKTIEKISLFGTPLERIDSKEIEIEIFPNRPDLISSQGFIRGFKAFLGKSTGLKKYPLIKPEKNFKVIVENSVKNIRPYTVCAIAKNLFLDEEKIKEIIELQEKLHLTIGRERKKVAIGIYPLEKIVLPITYKAMKPADIKFRPLDSDKEMTGLQILQKHPTGIRYSNLLKGFKEFPVFVDAKNKILSMPPIINSDETGKITKDTKSVFVECSGQDINTLKKVLNIIVTTLAEMQGKIYQINIHNDKPFLSPNFEPDKIKISLENVNKLLGLTLKQKDISGLLAKMGYDYKADIVSIPPWRTDIIHEVDIIEDIAIAYGYDNFIPEIPNVYTKGQESKESKIKNKIAELLVGLQLTEISTYHLIKQDEAKMIKNNRILEVQDSKTDYKILRPNLLIPTLRIFSENLDNEYPQKLFEIGRVFNINEKKETEIEERDNLIIALTPANFTEAKQVLDYLFRTLSIEYTINETDISGLIEGRTGEIILNNENIGYIGEIHPKTLNNWHLKMPMSIIEINLEGIYKMFN